jgi:hypothetical protein
MSQSLSPFCVYTIRHQKDLDEAYRAGGTSRFKENKAWKTGHRLFLEAQRNGQRMPVIFASADVTDKLRYYAVLSDFELDEVNFTTSYQFTDLQRIALILTRTHYECTIGRVDCSVGPSVAIM